MSGQTTCARLACAPRLACAALLASAAVAASPPAAAEVTLEAHPHQRASPLAQTPVDPKEITRLLQEAAAEVARLYNCSINIAFKNAQTEAAAAAGIADFRTRRPAATSDKYALGSLTKMLTGANIMKMVTEGKIDLGDMAYPHVDPWLEAIANRFPERRYARKLVDMWGPRNMKKLTIRRLLSMSVGTPDFDTAWPCRGPLCNPKDILRRRLYAHPNVDFPPDRLLNFSWVRGTHNFEPCTFEYGKRQTKFCYSSTNFILLGCILARDQNVSHWKEFDQGAFLPEHLKHQFTFIKEGSPKQHGLVPGYDRTKYNQHNGEHADHNNHEVKGVFAGWTGSNLAGTATDVARLTWEIYGPNSSILPPKALEAMLPRGEFYGLATSNMRRITGQTGYYGDAYGHPGATYGYQSSTAFHEKMQFVISVTSNLEVDEQTHPSYAHCVAYNKVLAYMLSKTLICRVVEGGFWDSSCECDQIDRDGVVTPMHGRDRHSKTRG